MLYRQKQKTHLPPSLFQNPSPEYRAFPFWAWNGELEPEVLLRQIQVFQQMGMGGFHMHARAGLSTPYLGEKFMDCVKACGERAKEEGLLAAICASPPALRGISPQFPPTGIHGQPGL